MRTLFRHGFMPFTLLVVAAAWAQQERVGRALRMDAMSALFLGLIAWVCLAEAFFPMRKEWQYRILSDVRGVGRVGRDLFYLFFVAQLTPVLLRLAEPRLKAVVVPRGWWPSGAPFLARVALAFLIVEFFSYGVHRAAHRVPLLWRFHSTHHGITELSGLKSLRVHPIDNLAFYVGRMVPLLFLGASAEEMTTATYLGGVLGILSHANVDLKEGWLGWVVNFPRYHSVHHSADVAESNHNFGCHTVLWDRLFGTFRKTPIEPLVIGVAPVGARSFWGELVRPFYSSRL